VERAVQLSSERYCPVIATVRGVAEIVTEIELRDEDERDEEVPHVSGRRRAHEVAGQAASHQTTRRRG
jgi:hypothetical protein